MQKKSYPITNVGSVSLLMVFIVLCLVTFATLSLSSSLGDYGVSEKIAKQNTAYYDAHNEAVLVLSEIDTTLAACYAQSSNDYMTNVEKALSSMPQVVTDFTTNNKNINYMVKINDTRALQVVLTVKPATQTLDGLYQIETWKEISTVTWSGDDSLKLAE